MSELNFPNISISSFTKIVECQIEEGNMRPIFGLGKGGIGKTEAVAEIAKRLNIGYIDVRLLLYNETDLKGIPYPDENHIKTIWLQNNILPLAERDGNRGILVFDEITSCARSVRTAAYQLLNERRLGEYVLPEGWIVVCLGNGPDDGGDFNGMEGNFLNRCSVYHVVVDADSWCDWAFENGVNELVIAYIRFKLDDLHTFDADKDLNLFASPRSWKAVSDILEKYKDVNFKTKDVSDRDRLIAYRIKGNLGTEVGERFISFLSFKNDVLDINKIMMGEGGAPSNKEVMFITVNSLIKYLRNKVESDEMDSEFTLQLANTFNWVNELEGNGSAEVKASFITDFTRSIRVNKDNYKEDLTYKNKIISVLLSKEFKSACTSYDELRKYTTRLS